jgi:purine-binding chemotaxis protein CheW
MKLEKDVETKTESYLTFKVGTEFFASNVSHINIIVEVPKHTKIPKAPGYMQGVMNLRGKVIPVIDTR